MSFPLPYYNTGVTVELREIVESGVKVFDFDYPVPRSEIQYNGKVCKVDFDKAAFEQKILDHYWCRQIGQETVGRFLHYFRTKMREIMPYYVQVYEFDAKFRNIEDPLESYNLKEEFTRATASTGKATGASTGSNESSLTSTAHEEDSNASMHDRRFSDTPQGAITIGQYVTEIEYNETDNRHNTDSNRSDIVSNSNEGTSETNSEGLENVTQTLTRRGNIGVQPLGGEVLNIRSAFINIDLQVINELADLFLMIY